VRSHNTSFFFLFSGSAQQAGLVYSREEDLLTEAAQLEAETKRAAAVSACWEDDRQAVAGSGRFFPPYPVVFFVSLFRIRLDLGFLLDPFSVCSEFFDPVPICWEDDRQAVADPAIFFRRVREFFFSPFGSG
jgi:hypothetical protein